MNFLNFICLYALTLIVSAEQRYDGYRVVEILPKTDSDVSLLLGFTNDPEFDTVTDIRGPSAYVRVALSPTAFEKYKNIFEKNGVEYKVIEKNLQDLIDAEAMSMVTSRFDGDIVSRVVAKYARHADVNLYLDTIAKANSEFLSTYTPGRTVEGRTLKVLRFKTANTKKSLWINCGVHAREWITIASCTYAIDKLISQYNAKNKDVVAILNYYELHILPVLNPDGYEYSQTERRLWRKNRKVKAGLGSDCVGVDLNRNFPFNWMVNGGASSNECSDVYAGVKAGSELETQAVNNIINSKIGNWDSYLDIHSFGLWYLLPYGYTYARPSDYNELERVAKISANAIASYNGTRFTVGSTAELLYIASGSGADWAYGKGIKYSYTLELRPSFNDGTGIVGFILPEIYGVHAGEELYRGLIALYNEIRKK